MKFILDENMSHLWRSYLRANYLEAYNWVELGRKSEVDELIVEYARKNGYVIITRDGDYGTILKKEKTLKPSVIYVRIDNPTPAAIGRRLLDVIRENRNQLESGAIIVIQDSKMRVRSLPFS